MVLCAELAMDLIPQATTEAVVDPGWDPAALNWAGCVCQRGGKRGHPQPPPALSAGPVCPPQEFLGLQDFNAHFCLISHTGNIPKQAAHAALLTIKRKDHIIAVINH